jgi:transposase
MLSETAHRAITRVAKFRRERAGALCHLSEVDMAGDYDRRKLVQTIHWAALIAMAEVRELVERSHEAIVSSRALLARIRRRPDHSSDHVDLAQSERESGSESLRGHSTPNDRVVNQHRRLFPQPLDARLRLGD